MPWNVLRAGDDGVLLTVDFSDSARDESGFPEFSTLFAPGCAVWETAPLGADPATSATGPRCVAAWCDEALRRGAVVRGVIGYCVGAVFAPAIAAGVSGTGAMPTVVLVDPEPASRDGVLRDFDRAVGQFRALLSEVEWTRTLARARELAAGSENIRSLGLALLAEFRAGAELAFDRAGVPPASIAGVTGELAARFGSLMSYHAAADETDSCPMWTDQVVIRSSGPARWPTPAARQLGFEVDHARILGTAAVADAVSGLLGLRTAS